MLFWSEDPGLYPYPPYPLLSPPLEPRPIRALQSRVSLGLISSRRVVRVGDEGARAWR